MSLGIIIILIVIFGSMSNSLNWKFLNYRLTYFLYSIGTLVHETSHALLCLATGAKIERFQVFSREPQVIHRKSKLPFLGEPLISFAPIVGGLFFLFFINRYLLGNYFTLSAISTWHDVLWEPFRMLTQINILQWQSWVMILLFINVGAMLGPSFQDIRNIWPILIILFFVTYTPLVTYGLIALSLILINIILQIILISFIHITTNFHPYQY